MKLLYTFSKFNDWLCVSVVVLCWNPSTLFLDEQVLQQIDGWKYLRGYSIGCGRI
jgi:hypothetical protein